MDKFSKKHLHIKNMVCPRCVQSVKEEAQKAGLKIKSLSLGLLVLSEKCTQEQLNQFTNGIEENGFKLLSNKREKLIENIKTEIISVVQHEKKIPGNQNFSTYLSALLGKDYSYLSNLFSTSEKTTIEKYIILQKIEKTKELLSYDELALKEIALKLGYGNTQHLSAQFKKITGMSPSEFKKSEEHSRISLDQVSLKNQC